METWATVVIIIVSNIIIAGVSVFTTRMQIKNSENELEKRLGAEREDYKHRQKWDSRKEPLIKMREEVACIGAKFESLINFATQYIEGFYIKSDKIIKEREKVVFGYLEKAGKEWEEYYYSGRFDKALHMQYDHSLKMEAKDIYLDYGLTYISLLPFLKDENVKGGKAEEKIHEAKEVTMRNGVRISEVQSKINKLLEEL